MSDTTKNITYYVVLAVSAVLFLFATGVGLWSLRPQPVVNSHLLHLSVAEVAAGTNNGTINIAEYLKNVFARLQTKESMNAFNSHETFPLASAPLPVRPAVGDKVKPLLGVAFSIADNINSKAFPTSSGSRSLSGFFPKQNALLVDYLVDAGAVMIGKNNLPEFNYEFTGLNSASGVIKNGHNDKLIGGSGAAAAVAARIVPFAVAADFLGQLRVSAAMNGVVGFRPSFARYPTEGVFTLSPTLESVGLIARSAKDVSLLDSVITEDAPAAEPAFDTIRLAIPRNTAFFQGLSANSTKLIESTLALFQAHGIELVEDDSFTPSQFPSIGNGSSIVQYEAIRNLGAYLTKYNPNTALSTVLSRINSESVKSVLKASSEDAVHTTTYLHQIQQRSAVQSAVDNYFTATNAVAMVVPTISEPAQAMNYFKAQNATVANYGHSSYVASIAGLPSITLPIGVTEAGPLAFEFIGKSNDDLNLIAVARAIERMLPVVDATDFPASN